MIDSFFSACLVLLALVPASTRSAQAGGRVAQDQGDAPMIRAEPERLDFGRVFAGETPSRNLTIWNMGRKDLLIEKIEFNCGCTVSEVTLPSGKRVLPGPRHERPIGVVPPGEAAGLCIEFGTSGILGESVRSLKIASNDPARSLLTVKMAISVRNPFRLEPQFVDFGLVEKGARSTREMQVVSTGVGPFRIRGIAGLPPHIRYEVQNLPAKDPPGYRLVFTLQGKGPSGYRRYKARLLVENDRVASQDFLLAGEIRSSLKFLFTPKGRGMTLDLGKISRKEGGRGAIEIQNLDETDPVEIKGIQVQCRFERFVRVRLETVKAGFHYRIAVEVKPGVPAAYLKGTLIASSPHPDMRSRRFQFIGQIAGP